MVRLGSSPLGARSTKLLNERLINFKHPRVLGVSSNVISDDLADAAAVGLEVANETLALISQGGRLRATELSNEAIEALIALSVFLHLGAKEAKEAVLAVRRVRVPKRVHLLASESRDLARIDDLLKLEGSRRELAARPTTEGSLVLDGGSKSRREIILEGGRGRRGRGRRGSAEAGSSKRVGKRGSVKSGSGSGRGRGSRRSAGRREASTFERSSKRLSVEGQSRSGSRLARGRRRSARLA